jgi:hypothetical protein
MSTAMLHEEAKELLSAYLDGELEQERRAALEAHLGEDPECAGELERLRALVGALRGLAVERPAAAPAPEEFLGGVQAKIRRRTHGRFFSDKKLRVPWEVVLVVVGVVLAGMYVLLQPGYLLPEHKGPLSAVPGGSATGGGTAGSGGGATTIPAPGAMPSPPEGSLDRAAGSPAAPGSRALAPVPGVAPASSTVLVGPAGPVAVHIDSYTDRTYTIRIDVPDADVETTRGAVIAQLRAAGDTRLTVADAAGKAPLPFAVPAERFKALADQLARTYKVSIDSTPVTSASRPAATTGTILVE